jgi:hypothetical protein
MKRNKNTEGNRQKIERDIKEMMIKESKSLKDVALIQDHLTLPLLLFSQIEYN